MARAATANSADGRLKLPRGPELLSLEETQLRSIATPKPKRLPMPVSDNSKPSVRRAGLKQRQRFEREWFMTTRFKDERFERLRPGFRRWLLISGGLLLTNIVVVAVTYGEHPVLAVSPRSRAAIALVGSIALIGFVLTGAMLVAESLLSRYSPAWKPESDTSKRRARRSRSRG